MGTDLLQLPGLGMSPFQQSRGTSDADDFPRACEGSGKLRSRSRAIEDRVPGAQRDGFPLLVGLFQILGVVLQEFLAGFSSNAEMLSVDLDEELGFLPGMGFGRASRILPDTFRTSYP